MLIFVIGNEMGAGRHFAETEPIVRKYRARIWHAKEMEAILGSYSIQEGCWGEKEDEGIRIQSEDKKMGYSSTVVNGHTLPMYSQG